MKYIILPVFIVTAALFNNGKAKPRYDSLIDLNRIIMDNQLSTDLLSTASYINITKDNKEEKMSLYPNPCRNQFSLKGNIAFTRIEIINAAGSTVKKYDKDDANKYNIRELQNGIYFIVLLDRNSKKKILKLIKK
jgi:hypothetical protein